MPKLKVSETEIIRLTDKIKIQYHNEYKTCHKACLSGLVFLPSCQKALKKRKGIKFDV